MACAGQYGPGQFPGVVENPEKLTGMKFQVRTRKTVMVRKETPATSHGQRPRPTADVGSGETIGPLKRRIQPGDAIR